MSKFGLFAVLAILATFPRCCDAMSANQRLVFDGARAAFAACRNLQGARILQGGKIVCLRGKITPNMFIDLMKIRDGIVPHPYVIVSGAGGYENSSIYIVRALNPLDPVPVVGDMCASACAQFLFLMGNQRVMLHCADIAIHGGPVSVEQILAGKDTDEVKQTLIAAAWRFRAFYYDRHISLDMVSKPPADIQKMLDAGQVVFWPWSINQLHAFGVKGIISENDPNRVVPKDFGKVCVRPLPTPAKSASA